MDSGVRRLIDDLVDARARTLALTADLADDQLLGPKLKIVNPLLWELGHIAWFQELWVLRRARGLDRRNHDALYDSSHVPHDTRWDLPLLTREETAAYLKDVHDEVVGAIAAKPPSNDELYFLRLSLFHEDMHGEAFAMTRQTLAYPAPAPPSSSRERGSKSPGGDLHIPGGVVELGAPRDGSFVFDNEKWAHEVHVEPFAISSALVTQREFRDFVEDGGYARRELWSEAGWAWRCAARADGPVYWRREGQGWVRREFDRVVALQPDGPMMNLCWFEAEAYARYANRRLPTEAEWMSASASPGWREHIGDAWEWTSDDFGPFEGFSVDPYEDYSRPWFGTHKVLKGGSWATQPRMIRFGYRNFYTPDRRDVFAGIRTCAA